MEVKAHALDRCSNGVESSSELSVERAGAANEALSIANSFRKKITTGNRDFEAVP